VRAVALAGLAWILLVAAMSQAGFSGEGRYALPGAALVSVAGAVVLARLARGHGRAAAAVLLLVLLAAAAPRLARLPDVHAGLAHAAALDADLARAVAAAGGRDAVLACGRPYVGPYRGPLLAWHLDVQKRAVGFAPRAPGTVFRSALRAGGPVEPTAPAGFAERARAGRWQVLARCAGAGAGAQPRSGRSG